MKQTVEEAARARALEICPFVSESTRAFIMGAQFGVEWYRKHLANMPCDEAMNEIDYGLSFDEILEANKDVLQRLKDK